MPTWAGIVRVSHVGRRQRDVLHADEDQVADIERYATLHGADVVFMEPELSVSGGKPIEERPSLREAIEGVESGRFDGIVVAYLSRLSRSRSGIEIWERVEAAGGHVHCAAENLDTSTPSGRFVRDIHLANAVREREEHTERHAKRRKHTVEAGVWRQRQIPRGYEFVGPKVDGRYRGKARRLKPGPDAAEVRSVFEARAAGAPVSALARRLGMTTSGVRYMLSNRVYLGEIRDGEYVNPDAHEPIVDEARWYAVQGTKATRPARAGTSSPALLAGLVRCAGCGHVMSRSRMRNVSYTCRGYSSAGACTGPAAITARLLDEHVEEIAIAEIARLAGTVSDDTGRVDEAQAALADAERELAAFLEAVQAAELPAGDYAEGLRLRRERRDDARRALAAAQAAAPAMVQDDILAAWPELDDGERNHLLRGLIEAVVVQAAGRGRIVPVADRVRVVKAGARLPGRLERGGYAGGGGGAFGIRPIRFADLNDDDVLRVPAPEDLLPGSGG